MGVGLDLFGGLVCVTSVEKDKFPTENFPEIKGSHREISGGKYTTERKETSSCPKRKFGGGAQLARIEPKELKARNQLGLTESSMFGEHLSVHKRIPCVALPCALQSIQCLSRSPVP